MENRSHALMTGFFTIALLVATVLAGLWFNRDNTERVPYEIATVQSIPGLNPQATVRYRGLEVGKVDEIIFDQSRAGQILIRLSVDKAAPVTRTTFATLGYQGVTGIAFIQLDDEKVGSALLPSSAQQVARIPLRPGFLDQLEKRGMVILEKAERIATSVENLVSPANQKVILGAFDRVGKAADALEAVPRALEPTLARLPALANQADQTLVSIRDLSNSANQAARNYDQLATTLQAPDGPIARLNTTVDRVGGSLEAVTSELELQTLPHLTSMADEAKTSLRAVRRTADALSNRPQSILFGAPDGAPGPGEPGFVPPTK
ncbi:MlaD family protein [Massilia sp. PAMC28688]|uniref:MlaD family protein n=1 Tax=Massilia sp. PAMC28688 TaxID=2861283 RepID=UPI001C62FFF8|nr:MlaD family protein [Massilia sp. PAMC28688]QYF95454.1 MlaD family protein [Massilia sp. PAMC28688]